MDNQIINQEDTKRQIVQYFIKLCTNSGLKYAQNYFPYYKVNCFENKNRNDNRNENKNEKWQKRELVSNNERVFIWTCGKGTLETVKWLYKEFSKFGNFNIHTNDEQAFRIACYYGNLEVIKWLYNLGKNNKDIGIIDIHILKEDAFKSACENNHLNVIKYLLSIGNRTDKKPIDIYPLDSYVTYMSHRNLQGAPTESSENSSNGRIPLRIRKDINNDEMLLSACCKGSLDVAKYLYSIGEYDIYKNNNELFEWTCFYGQTEVADWLYSLGGIDLDCITKDTYSDEEDYEMYLEIKETIKKKY